MSLRVYCFSCGAPSEYSLVAPLFCTSCGKSLKNSSAATIQTATSIKKATKTRLSQAISVANEEDDDSIDNNIIPQLDELEIELDLSDRRGFTIGQIAASAKVEVIDKKVKPISKKQALEDFQKQASALKNRESSEVS